MEVPGINLRNRAAASGPESKHRPQSGASMMEVDGCAHRQRPNHELANNKTSLSLCNSCVGEALADARQPSLQTEDQKDCTCLSAPHSAVLRPANPSPNHTAERHLTTRAGLSDLVVILLSC
jgi:hypothetical protein